MSDSECYKNILLIIQYKILYKFKYNMIDIKSLLNGGKLFIFIYGFGFVFFFIKKNILQLR
jgi:hypothetical protein